MKTKILVILSTITLGFNYSLWADSSDLCSKDNSDWNGTKCATTGTAATATVASGIYAAKKYSQADSIEKEFTKRLFEGQDNKSSRSMTNINSDIAPIKDGDKVTVRYQLSEKENRLHHIDLMESSASSARSSAAFYTSQAATATRTVIENGPNGSTSTRVEPDYGARTTYAAMAVNSYNEALEYDKKAANARNGGPVPVYTLEKILDEQSKNLEKVSQFSAERIEHGGKIVNIDRLPVAKYNLVKGLATKARAGVGGVVLGAGLTIYEAVSGAAAKSIDTSKADKYNRYDDGNF